jgi:hypothetical protein
MKVTHGGKKGKRQIDVSLFDFRYIAAPLNGAFAGSDFN